MLMSAETCNKDKPLQRLTTAAMSVEASIITETCNKYKPLKTITVRVSRTEVYEMFYIVIAIYMCIFIDDNLI